MATVAALVGVSVAAADPGTLGIAATPAAHASYLERTQELVIRALAMIGVTYKFGGNSPDQGLDCSGLVNLVFREAVGLILPRNSTAMSKMGSKIDKTRLEPGDLVFFNTRKQHYSHVGIYIGEQRFVHAPSPGREVEIADMQDRYWRTRYDGARRINF